MTTKYTFKQEYGGFDVHHYGSPPSTVTMEISGDLNLTQMLERFEDFLRGCGFGFEGHLDFVNDYDDTLTSESDGNNFVIPTDDTIEHSGFYFDADRNK